jgi:hypothetical protein
VGTGIAAAVTKVRQFVSAVGIGFGLDAVASDMQRGLLYSLFTGTELGPQKTIVSDLYHV